MAEGIPGISDSEDSSTIDYRCLKRRDNGLLIQGYFNDNPAQSMPNRYFSIISVAGKKSGKLMSWVVRICFCRLIIGTLYTRD